MRLQAWRAISKLYFIWIRRGYLVWRSRPSGSCHPWPGIAGLKTFARFRDRQHSALTFIACCLKPK